MCFKKPLGLTCKKFNWDRNDRRDAQKESSITQIQWKQRDYKNHVAKHPNCTFVSLVDFVGRASIEETLLAVQVEEATVVVGVANDAAARSTTSKASTPENGGHGNNGTQDNEEENRVTAEERPSEE
jgi:hypothetical protein